MSLYAAAGVDYDVLDAGKRAAVAAALSTTAFSHARGATGVDASRGEPAFLFGFGGLNLAVVLECLGTKSTIARQYQDATGVNRFDSIGYDSVAAIVNDLICVGALPLVVNAYFATGSPDWYSADGRFVALVEGWRKACEDAGATWGGGESPGLSGIIAETEIDLAGSAVGAVPEGCDPVLGEHLAAGDEIVLVASTGLHANGASLARATESKLEDGYATLLPSGATFGDAVLSPSAVYVGLVDELLKTAVPITYLSHITGHGFRKVMRADRDFTYRITEVPPVPEVLGFLVEQTEMSPADAYGTFNMGAGFAVYCKAGSGDAVVAAAERSGHEAWVAGVVENGDRSVVIEPLGISYAGHDLELR